ncbi:MAG: flagellar filament capping protein FliD [Cellulosilyticaceae bacterium]
MRTTNIRFTGLASGLDTESMVKAMAMPYQMKVDSSKQQKQLLELKKDAWKDLNKKIWDFHTQTLNTLRLESTFGKTNIAVSNPSIIELDKNITLPEGNHTIDIKQMATGATVSSSSIKDKLINGKKDQTTLAGLGIKDGTVIEVNTGKGSIAPITIGKIQDKDSAGNPITRDMTVEDLEKQLSAQLGEKGVSCKFDEGVGAFVITSKATGKNETISLSSKGPDGTVDNVALGALGFVESKGAYQYGGQEAIVTYNGGITVTSESNHIEINGIKFTIKGESTSPITITSTKDPDAIVDTVKKFVDEYNKLIEEMDKLISAPKNKDYLPLTAEQKASMSDEEIKLWDEKVKGSLLSGDSTIKDMLSSMRSLLGGVVEGNSFSMLSDIGITTANWKEKGKLYIDEKKLRDAIDKDKQGVVNLLAGQGDPKVLYDKENGQGAWETLGGTEAGKATQEAYLKDNKNKLLGLGDRLYNAMNERTKSSDLKSSNTFYNDKAIQKQITDYSKKISDLEERLARTEDLYYKKFAAMEKMMSQLNSQSNWLSGQIGGM